MEILSKLVHLCRILCECNYEYAGDKSITMMMFLLKETIENTSYSKDNIMELVDYTGKINSHNEYLESIKQLEKKSKYVEYVLVNEEDTRFIEEFKDFIITMKQKNKWWGTKSCGKSKVYKIKSSKAIFNYLKQFETFCKYSISYNGDIIEYTDFGINDIAFFDDNEIPLLFTTTHEGYITIRNDLFL